MTDVILPVIAAAMSLASAIFGYRAGRSRGSDHARELNQIGKLLRLRRQRGERDDDYAARLIEHMEAR